MAGNHNRGLVLCLFEVTSQQNRTQTVPLYVRSTAAPQRAITSHVIWSASLQPVPPLTAQWQTTQQHPASDWEKHCTEVIAGPSQQPGPAMNVSAKCFNTGVILAAPALTTRRLHLSTLRQSRWPMPGSAAPPTDGPDVRTTIILKSIATAGTRLAFQHTFAEKNITLRWPESDRMKRAELKRNKRERVQF